MPSTKIWRLIPTIAGFIKSRYPDGNDAAEPPIWAVIPDQVQKSAAYSQDMATYLSGPYTSMSLIVVTGVLSGSGWSFAGTTLTYSGSGTGVLTVRIQANNGATVAKSNLFRFESIAVQSVDTIPATIPTYISATLSANKPVISWQASSDPALEAVSWSDIASYQLLRGGVQIASITETPGTKFVLRETLIGAPTTTGTITVDTSTAQIAFQAGGANYFNTADDGDSYGGSVTGDFFASCRVDAFTCSNAAAKLMIDCRASTATNAAHVAASLFPLSSGRGTNLYYRTSAGGQTLKNTDASYTGSVIWLALQRVGDVFTFSYSPNGLDYVTHSSVTVALPSTVYLALAGCAQQVGTLLSATVNQWNVSQQGLHTYTDSTAAANTSYSYTLKATDGLGNQSAASTAKVIATQPTSIGTLTKLVDFASGTLTGLSTTGRVSTVTSPLRRNGGGTSVGSGFSMRSFMDKNQTGFGTSALTRAEISGIYNTPPLFVPIWYGWSVYFPSNFTLPNNVGPNGKRLTTWEIITQFHASGVFVGANPTVSLSSYQYNDWNGQTLITAWPALNLAILGDDRDPTTWSALPSKDYQTKRKFSLPTPVAGKWFDFVMRVVWDYRQLTNGGIGHVKYWVNGALYIDEALQNCMNESVGGGTNSGPYMKVGQYKGWDNTTNVLTDSVYASPGTREFNHAEIAIALESAGGNFATVDPVTRVGPRP